MRIAVIDYDRCQPRKCRKQCINFCPGVRMGDETITMNEKLDKPEISEQLCTGCGICVKKCPYEAITIINLPNELGRDKVHQYGENGFRIFRLPYPTENSVTAILGKNGVGKTTIVRILSGEIVPNFGGIASKEKVLKHFSGTQFYDYFKALYSGKIKTVAKPQYVDAIPKVIKGKVKELLEKADEKGEIENIIRELDLDYTLDKDISKLSGGELQRVTIAIALLRDAELYIFDEPSSYLDAGQRLKVGKLIRKLAENRRILVVEHDLMVMDYLADYVNIVYGKPGAFGVVALPKTKRQGINAYLLGYLKEENVRIRQESVKFEVKPPSTAIMKNALLNFKPLKKSYKNFTLETEAGEVYRSEIIGILGPNATGKTTFVKMLAGVEKPDEGEISLNVKVSYKPQYIKPEFEYTVFEAISKVTTPGNPFFKAEIARPLELKNLYEKKLKDLSGGELQSVAIALCLGRDAEIYLLDEPSAYLDVEQRLAVAKMIRRVIEKKEALGIVVDHDILFIDYISDRCMVFMGEPGKEAKATSPLSLRSGMNFFLKNIGITFRRDMETGRPRANKPGSQKDEEQKKTEEYYYQVA
ncbi:putative ABC transporter ATP-binding protein/MT2552 [archaeon]|nr:putative ABC transporter ATP-binding protein/MT2552 [archaeon]